MSTETTNKTDNSETPTTADMARQITSFREDLNGVAQNIKELAVAKKDEAASAALDHAANAGKAVVDQVDTARLHGMMAQDRATDFVRSQPIVAIGIAAGIGVLIGALTARR